MLSAKRKQLVKMNTIFKYCEEKFNITKGCNTLQLGTLEYYRDLDPSFSITDSNEGILGAEAINGPIVFERGEALGTGFGNGTYRGKLTFEKSLNISAPNVYIFSATLNSVNEFWPEYNSFYIIKNLNDFCETIVYILRKAITLDDIKQTKFSLNQLNSLRFEVICKPVTYIKKPFEFTNENKIDVMNKVYNPENMFMKCETYSREREIRIAFILTDGKKIYSVNKQPKIIDLNLLKSCLF